MSSSSRREKSPHRKKRKISPKKKGEGGVETVDNYRVYRNEVIGRGGFGAVYRGVNIVTDTPVAVKIEPKTNKHQLLLVEYDIVRYLNTKAGTFSNPRFLQALNFKETETEYIMVTQLLGESLDRWYKSRDECCSFDEVLIIALGVVEQLKLCHQNNIIHRDIKPANFLWNSSGSLTLIDFGFAKKYRNRFRNQLPYREHTRNLGTVRYMSLNAHSGLEQSPRDDLISVCYLLLYLLEGELPWSKIGATDRKKRNRMIAEMKRDYSADDLVPKEGSEDEAEFFKELFRYVFELNYDQVPEPQLHAKANNELLMKKRGIKWRDLR